MRHAGMNKKYPFHEQMEELLDRMKWFESSVSATEMEVLPKAETKRLPYPNHVSIKFLYLHNLRPNDHRL